MSSPATIEAALAGILRLRRIEAAAEDLAALWDAEERAALESCRSSAATATRAPDRRAVLEAVRRLREEVGR